MTAATASPRAGRLRAVAGRALTGLRRVAWAIPGFAAFLVLRVPSFFEPHWYTDEAGYMGVASAVLRGRVLYTQVWTNKPPLHIVTIAAVRALFGSSEAALHGLTLISGLVALAAIAWCTSRLWGTARAAAAVVLAGLLLGTPVLDAELALPESVLIAPLAWAGALLLVRMNDDDVARRHGMRWPAVVGVLVAVAACYQQTVLADAGAFTLLLLLSPRVRRRQLGVFLGAFAATTAAWLVPAILLAGAGRLAYALVGFYVPFTQAVLPSDTAAIHRHLELIALASVLVVSGGWLLRRSTSPGWMLLLWTGSSLLVPALAQQPYAHYLTASAIPMCMGFPALLRRPELRTVLRAAPSLAALVIAAGLARVAGLDWIQPIPSSPTAPPRNLGMYYGGAISMVGNSTAVGQWKADFDTRVAGDQDVADWLKANGYTGATAVVWSSDAWLYSMAGLSLDMPTPPIYNDEVLLGSNGETANYVASLEPEVIVTSDDALQAFPDIIPVLQSEYHAAYTSSPDTVWILNGGDTGAG